MDAPVTMAVATVPADVLTHVPRYARSSPCAMNAKAPE
jgi:hypothetical protein